MSTPLPKHMIDTQIAIVLTDIIGSTKYVQKVGTKQAAVRFSQHDRLVLALITRHKGQWVDNSDGHLMYFSTVHDAIAFSFDYKRKLKAIGFPFRSRVGIHYDSMIIIKASERLIQGGVKRISIEGLGKNIAARIMSLCGPDQILLSQAAYVKFKSRLVAHKYIPSDALAAFVGLYRFKGVAEPEKIYALGTEQIHLQPPENIEKAKRLGGAKKVRTQLKHKKFKEIFYYFFWKITLVYFSFIIIYFWPLLISPQAKHNINIDFSILKIFEYINHTLEYLHSFIQDQKP
jgi:class 3 adenylate cyclase